MVSLRKNRCDFCGTCVSVCPVDAIVLYEAKLEIVTEKCIGCKNCVTICPIDALEWNDDPKI